VRKRINFKKKLLYRLLGGGLVLKQFRYKISKKISETLYIISGSS